MLGTTVRSLAAVIGAVAVTMSVSVVSPAVATGYAASVTTPRVASMEPATGAVVGVAHPVTLRFAAPVANRAAAEDSVLIESPATPPGEFTWLSDSELQWNPTGFWPAHSPISVSSGDFAANFETGAAVVGVADIDAHTFTVSVDDQVVREMPASMGKPKFPTPTGTFRVLGKESVVVMDSRTIGIPLDDPEGYKLTVYDAVRITWGGVYVHGAPWSTGSQGYANVSHGCINLSPDNAAWYFDMVGMGDPVIVQA
ncbi:L,D-transpeptidase [Mycobacterium sp. PS03-16]|uniref:L,D-transpeptidase n=1 Tax=Mycobacterium sp. PS03-16 TaxID=2559611 RepID=UPI0010737E4F|nr:L,D-transpeptidase [Mycobacterium sp. PS03-16]TFV54701.1 L,D-transpeptidase [Mycobacterium sp. PS03-16]